MTYLYVLEHAFQELWKKQNHNLNVFFGGGQVRFRQRNLTLLNNKPKNKTLNVITSHKQKFHSKNFASANHCCTELKSQLQLVQV